MNQFHTRKGTSHAASSASHTDRSGAQACDSATITDTCNSPAMTTKTLSKTWVRHSSGGSRNASESAATRPLLVPARYCYVSSAYVRPEHRRQGVLRALMRSAREWCAERGLTEMRLHTASGASEAAATWSALGFDVVEEVRRLELSPMSV